MPDDPGPGVGGAMRFYLFLRPRRWRVTVYLHRDHSFDWYRIIGVTLGRWFIGAIQGSPSTPDRGDTDAR